MIARSPDEVRKLVSTRRWKRKHLEALRRKFGDQALFDALFSAFTQKPPVPYAEQVTPGDSLLELKPKGVQELQSLIRASLAGWNLSIEQLPYYFRETYGIEAVRLALDRIEVEAQLNELERKALRTYRYWLHLPQNAEPVAAPIVKPPNTIMNYDPIEDIEALNKIACIKDGFIVLDPDDVDYSIKLDRCDTHTKIVWWVSHLAEKTWITVPMIERFIDLACEHHGLPAHGPC